MIDAVVLAGGINDGALSHCSQAQNEALIEINKQPMVGYVISALMNASQINNIYIVGLEKITTGDNYPEDRVFFLPGESTVIENVLIGIEKCQTNQVLITASDIPLLSGKAIDEFILLCRRKVADFYYPIIDKKIIEGTFPKMQRTYVKTKEGIFTGGNVFLVTSEVIPPIAFKVQEFIKKRKSPLKLCGLLGLKFIILFLLKKLTILRVERKVSHLVGIKALAIIVNSPEIGIDVDKPSDLEIVNQSLKKLC